MLAILSTSVQAADSGAYFSHQDWEVACDNTGTCRAAGYQDFDDPQSVSVLLTRNAGPDTPVTGKLRIGEVNLDDVQLASLHDDPGIALRIDGRLVGNLEIDPDSLTADLPEKLVAALLAVFHRNSDIEWTHDDYRWHLSDAGATAVLTKMDDVQGRVGTPGALVATGSNREGNVPPPTPAPVVVAVPVAEKAGSPQPLPTGDRPDLRTALAATLGSDDECLGLSPSGNVGELEAVRLTDRRLLVSTTCWMGAYNMGTGYWVVNDTAPYQPALVTLSASGYEDGTIYAAQKGRGLGDCWSRDDWTWNGERFVHTASYTTGKCRLIAAGGAWILPTLVTEVQKTSETH
ncbi:DUF1176 domain-containing protein [Marinobacter halodurans]|uniref:DUF1176 domain-containing protein n=2 Tax=Marinobacter halodurans TaxID=2528979 RepID=A0ABY1ZFK1_9GAMM|nr:DUF1176 domain-containing protein [Marinobacter halodurans]